MFTGIIQTVGTIAARSRHSLSVKAPLRARPGDSIAVNGACLTATRAPKRGILSFDVSAETWRRTNLGGLSKGERVNLEPALRAGEALGGHLVSGHVDAPARLLALERLPEGFSRLRVELPAELRRLVALKGSVAVDGVSLTVTKVSERWFESVLVPHTLIHTNLAWRRPGDILNVEVDLIARYVRAALGKR